MGSLGQTGPNRDFHAGIPHRDLHGYAPNDESYSRSFENGKVSPYHKPKILIIVQCLNKDNLLIDNLQYTCAFLDLLFEENASKLRLEL